MGFREKSDLDQNKFLVEEQLRLMLQHTPPVEFIKDSVLTECKDAHSRIHDMLSRALELGESNSALLIGPRGIGKSTLLRVALSHFTQTPDVGGANMNVSGNKCSDGILVRLHGLMQTDDRQALREITRQLQLEEKTSTKQFGSFAENLTFLLSSLKEGKKASSKSVIFILEEFDLFCNHGNQTLLYNLFDIAQSAQNPICVIGLTCRLDVIELLEKRVRSRFSHRQIHMMSPDIDQFCDIAKQILSLPKSKQFKANVLREWNSHIEDLFEDDEVDAAIQDLHCVSRDLHSLKQMLVVAVGSFSANSVSQFSPEIICNSVKQILIDATPRLIQSLSTLQIALLIAMMHLTKANNEEYFNFEMVHFEYLKYTRRYSSVNSFNKAVVFKAFDQLCHLELVTPQDSVSRNALQKEYLMMKLQLPPILLKETLSKVPNLPTDLLQWSSFALA